MNQSLDNSSPSTDQLVTAVITHRVKSGETSHYEEWIKGIAADARAFPGHLGVSILRPKAEGPSDYVIVLQFDDCGNLTNWLNSDVRRGWIEQVKPLIETQEDIQVLTGLEAWFEVPSRTPAHRSPRRYKQAILVWVGVMIVAIAVHPIAAPIVGYFPFPFDTALNVAITVGLLTYVIMPLLTRSLKQWLFD